MLAKDPVFLLTLRLSWSIILNVILRTSYLRLSPKARVATERGQLPFDWVRCLGCEIRAHLWLRFFQRLLMGWEWKWKRFEDFKLQFRFHVVSSHVFFQLSPIDGMFAIHSTPFVNQRWTAVKGMVKIDRFTLLKTNMTMENPPFEECISYWTWGFSNVMLVFRGVPIHCLWNPEKMHRIRFFSFSVLR